jgi:hypothetical protein
VWEMARLSKRSVVNVESSMKLCILLEWMLPD